MRRRGCRTNTCFKVTFGILSISIFLQLVSGYRFDADGGRIHNAAILKTHPGFAGNGYADFGGKGAWIEWDVNIPSDGDYEILIRYCAASSRPAELTVDDGQTPAANFDFRATHTWTNWSTETNILRLKQGSRKIKVLAKNSDGPNLDYIEIHKVQVANEQSELGASVMKKAGERFDRGQFVYDTKGNYKIGMSQSGDLVLHDRYQQEIWSSARESKLANKPGYRCFMQGDGNLVIRDESGSAVWASHTSALGTQGDVKLVLADSGAAALERNGSVVWQTTSKVASRESSDTTKETKGVTLLKAGETLDLGEERLSPSGEFKVILAEKGLVMLKQNEVIWESQLKHGSVPYRCFMQDDGNLIIRNHSLDTLWSSNTSENDGATLTLDDSGRISVKLHGIALWVNGVPQGTYTGPSSANLQFPVRGAFYYPWCTLAVASCLCFSLYFYLTNLLCM